MLAVAIQGDDPVIASGDGVLEGGAQACAIAEVARMMDRLHGRERAKELGGPIGRSIVNDQDVLGISQDLREHGLEVSFLVIDRNGRQEMHCRIGFNVRRFRQMTGGNAGIVPNRLPGYSVRT